MLQRGLGSSCPKAEKTLAAGRDGNGQAAPGHRQSCGERAAKEEPHPPNPRGAHGGTRPASQGSGEPPGLQPVERCPGGAQPCRAVPQPCPAVPVRSPRSPEPRTHLARPPNIAASGDHVRLSRHHERGERPRATFHTSPANRGGARAQAPPFTPAGEVSGPRVRDPVTTFSWGGLGVGRGHPKGGAAATGGTHPSECTEDTHELPLHERPSFAVSGPRAVMNPPRQEWGHRVQSAARSGG